MRLKPAPKAKENGVARSRQKVYDVAAPTEGAVDVPLCLVDYTRNRRVQRAQNC